MPETAIVRPAVATAAEIKRTARKILVAEGLDAVTLRAIAREMGMTAPALLRCWVRLYGMVSLVNLEYPPPQR